MRPFIFDSAATPREAIETAQAWNSGTNGAAQYLAGGTTLIDLMKLDVMRPQRLVDINALQRTLGGIDAGGDGLRLGAMARMADVADHPVVKRDYPVIAQSLQLAASQ